jgi:lysophospholipase L1-like esterase
MHGKRGVAAKNVRLGMLLATACSTSAFAGDCPADLNGDREVNQLDLQVILMTWGLPDERVDLNHDGIVNGEDCARLFLAWGPCPECGRVEFVHGDAEALVAMRDGGARVLLVGDSISNSGSTQFSTLFHAAICTWKPVAWRGVHTNPASGGDQGHYVLAGVQSPPGVKTAFATIAPDLAGQYTSFAEAFRYESDEPGSQILTATVDHRIFASERLTRPRLYRIGRPFENASGEVDFINRAGPVEFGLTLLSNGEYSAVGLRYVDRIRMRSWRLGASESQLAIVDVAGDPEELSMRRCSIIWDSAGMDGTPIGSLTQLKVLGDPSAVEDAALVALDFYLGRPDRPEGLTIAYAGYGGWRAKNHRFPMGDPRLSDLGGERQGYSHSALRERIATLESTHYLIHLGTNDLPSGTSLTADEFVADLEGVMDRIRHVHLDLGRSPPVFVILGMYLTGQDGQTTNRPIKESVRTKLIAAADTDRSFIYLDLHGYLDSVFNLLDIDRVNRFADTWLLDGVHLNPKGAEAIGRWIWSCIEEAAACDQP